MKPFKNLRIVELASVLAGPSVGLFFAELGAKVIKIENKLTRGDVTRSWKLSTEDSSENTSAYFYSVNRFKKHLFLDFFSQKDMQVCINEIAKADVVICNFKKGDDIKFNLDFNSLKKIQPSIIYASINGFGEDIDRAAYDLILQAESGFMSINGEKNSSPLKMPVALIDLLAGHQLKEAILIALLEKEKKKKAKKITVSLFDAAIASLVNQATNYLIANTQPKQQGSIHPNIAPYGEIFKTKDKQLITFALGTDKQFFSLLQLLNLENTIKLTICKTNQLRVKNRKYIEVKLQEAISKINFESIYSDCLSRAIPIGKIRSIKEALELKESQHMIISSNENGKKIKSVKSIAFKFFN
jgi:crotonobetainyl-CoA:carnitine CoA-transferase CaiB-like acyl-CoA transferase